MNPTRADLEAAFEKFQDTPLEGDRGETQMPVLDDELSLLHAELQEYDGYIAGLIMQILDGIRHLSHPLEVETGLRRRLEVVANGSDRRRAAVAERYIQRLDELDNLVRLGRATLATSSTQREDDRPQR